MFPTFQKCSCANYAPKFVCGIFTCVFPSLALPARAYGLILTSWRDHSATYNGSFCGVRLKINLPGVTWTVICGTRRSSASSIACRARRSRKCESLKPQSAAARGRSCADAWLLSFIATSNRATYAPVARWWLGEHQPDWRGPSRRLPNTTESHPAASEAAGWYNAHIR